MSHDRPVILFLGPEDSTVLQWLQSCEKNVFHTADKIDADFVPRHQIGFIISYGYRHILKKPILDLLPNRIVNLHISYLPWNRGADPNLWSFVEDTPKGVTIHYVDQGVDTGDIIVQRELKFLDSETLSTTYQKLQNSLEGLFYEYWDAIKRGSCPRLPQKGPGTHHKTSDRQAVVSLLSLGWDTPVGQIRGRLRA